MKSLDPHMGLCVKYAIKMLLTSDTFAVLKPFVLSMEEIELQLPGFLPPLGKAVVKLANANLANVGEP